MSFLFTPSATASRITLVASIACGLLGSTTTVSADPVSSLLGSPCDSEPVFERGDPSGDGISDITDGILMLQRLFLGVGSTGCKKALDTDDNGKLEVSDPIQLMGHIFLGTRAPAPPFGGCGVDPTPDKLSCDAPPTCGDPAADTPCQQNLLYTRYGITYTANQARIISRDQFRTWYAKHRVAGSGVDEGNRLLIGGYLMAETFRAVLIHGFDHPEMDSLVVVAIPRDFRAEGFEAASHLVITDVPNVAPANLKTVTTTRTTRTTRTIRTIRTIPGQRRRTTTRSGAPTSGDTSSTSPVRRRTPTRWKTVPATWSPGTTATATVAAATRVRDKSDRKTRTPVRAGRRGSRRFGSSEECLARGATSSPLPATPAP